MRSHVAFISITVLLAFLAACSSGQDAREHLRQADDLEASGQIKAAVIELKRALQIAPNLAAARSSLGRMHVMLGDPVSAEKELRKAQELGASPADISPWLLESLLLQGRYAEVLREPGPGAAAMPQQRAETLVRKAEAALALGKLGEAAEGYRKAEELAGDMPRSRLGDVRLAVARGQMNEALKLETLLLKEYPDSAQVSLVSGWLHTRLGEYSRAEQAFLQALALAHPEREAALVARARLMLTETYLNEGRLAEAGSSFDLLRDMTGDSDEVIYLGAVLDYRSERYTEAWNFLETLLARQPKHLEGQLLAGATLYALGQYNRSAQYLTQYLYSVPSNVLARRLLAAAELKRGNSAAALNAIGQMESSNGDAEWLSLIGRAAIVEGDYETAENALTEAVNTAPDNELLRTRLARFQMLRGELDVAIEGLSADSGSGNSSARSGLIEALLAQGKFDEAKKAASALKSEAPMDPGAWVLFGIVELSSGEFDRARAAFAQALSLKADFVPALIALGHLSLRSGDLKAAQRRFGSALESDPDAIPAMLGMAQSEGLSGDFDAVEKWLQRAVNTKPAAPRPKLWLADFLINTAESPRAIEQLEEAERLAGADSMVLAGLARLNMSLGRSANAVRAAERLVALRPGEAGARLLLANLYMESGSLDKARETTDEAVRLDDRRLATLVPAAGLRLGLGDAKASRELAEQIKSLDSKVAIGWALSGDAWMMEGRAKRAVTEYEKALDREFATAYVLRLARAFEAAGEVGRAIDTLQHGRIRFPADPVVMRELGSVFFRAGRRGDARQAYMDLIAVDPTDSTALNNLAWLLLDTNKSEALVYARRAYEQNKSPLIADTLGWVLVQAEEAQEALPLLQKAAVQVSMPTVHYHLAVALDAVGRKVEAKDVVSGLLEAETSFPERDSAEALRKRLGGQG